MKSQGSIYVMIGYAGAILGISDVGCFAHKIAHSPFKACIVKSTLTHLPQLRMRT